MRHDERSETGCSTLAATIRGGTIRRIRAMRKIMLGAVAVVGFSAFAPAANASWLTHLFSSHHREPVCVDPGYGHGGYRHDSGYRGYAPRYEVRPAPYVVVP